MQVFSFGIMTKYTRHISSNYTVKQYLRRTIIQLSYFLSTHSKTALAEINCIIVPSNVIWGGVASLKLNPIYGSLGDSYLRYVALHA